MFRLYNLVTKPKPKNLFSLRCVAAYLLLAMIWTCNANAAPHTVTLSWIAPTATLPAGEVYTGYKIYRGTTAGGELTTAYATVQSATILSFTDTAVVGGTPYFYKITAMASCDNTVLNCAAAFTLANGAWTAESAASVEVNTNGPIPLPNAVAPGAPQNASAAVN